MSAQGRGYTYSYREALTILGNGDAAKGRKLIDELAKGKAMEKILRAG